MTEERIAVLLGGPRDGGREPILGLPHELTYEGHVYKRLHPHRTRGKWHDYGYIGERGRIITGDFDENGEPL